MECSEIITDENIYDFIFENNPRILDINPITDQSCIERVDDNWSVGYGTLWPGYQMNVGDLGYQTIPKLYAPVDTTSMEASGITATLNQPFLDVRGQGVIIGFLDTGIDYLSDVFKFSETQSKIAVIWDQTVKAVNSESNVNGDLYDMQKPSYGTVYTREQIDEALKAAAAGKNPYDYVSTTDGNGHGTFLAGLAAGNTTQEFTGAAPMAEIAMVKLKPAKKYLRDFFLTNEDAVLYQETDIMLGVRFLLDYADLRRMPIVICLGLCTGSGPRSGDTPLGSVLAYAARRTNVAVVTAVGNEANNRGHFRGMAQSDTEPVTVEINVGEGEQGFVAELWVNTLDVLSISLISPSGEVIPRIPARAGKTNIFRFLLEGSEVTVDYKVVEHFVGEELIFMRFITPRQGIWTIKVYSLTNISGEFDIWLPMKQVLSSDTFFLSSNPDTTLLEPSADKDVITAGGYNHTTGGDYIDSGRGYTVLGGVKPDIAAPAVNVYGPKPGGGYTYMTGTSVAAAHVAGAAALIFTWGSFFGNIPLMTTSDIKYILIRGADRSSGKNYPNNIQGDNVKKVLNVYYKSLEFADKHRLYYI